MSSFLEESANCKFYALLLVLGVGTGLTKTIFFLCNKHKHLLFIHVSRVPQRERDDLTAQALLVVDCPIGPDEGVQVSVD